MLNENEQIEVRVGGTFNDGENEYLAVRPKDCSICCFGDKEGICPVLACLCNERKDGIGVHFIKLSREELR